MATRKTDWMKQAVDAVNAGAANGWEIINATTVRRLTQHDTPQYAMDNGWYPSPTYSTCEFLSFVFMPSGRVPKVVYGTAPCPWVGRSDASISFKRAKELLAQPLADAAIHDRD